MLTTKEAVVVAVLLTLFLSINFKGWVDDFAGDDGYRVARTVSQMIAVLILVIWFFHSIGILPPT